MSVERHDFGAVQRIETDAVGTPGRRRFRLVAQNGNQTAFLWLQKEQLQALGLAVDQLLSPVKAIWTQSSSETTAASPAPFDGAANLELQVGRLGLGFDEDTKKFVLVAHDVEAGPEDAPNFRCECTRAQLSKLSEEITAVATAGRPRCPICGAPLDDQVHFCPGSNGHGRHQQ